MKGHNHNDNEDDHAEHLHNVKDEQYHKSKNNKKFSPEITALLIKTNSPVANINLPRQINRENSFLAALPANEITRLISMLGFGSKSFKLLSFILIIFAGLSIFSGLAANLENRMTDLAILRALGYSKNRIFKMICIEGLFNSFNWYYCWNFIQSDFISLFCWYILPIESVKHGLHFYI